MKNKINVTFLFLSLIKIITGSKLDCGICRDPMRIMVLLDESGTMGEKNFEVGKNALTKLVDNIDISNITSQLGIIKFSTKSKEVINISPDFNAIKKSITNMKYEGGWTNTKSAFNMARINEHEHWNNTEVIKILLLITDGLPQMDQGKLHKEKELTKTIKVVDKFKTIYPHVNIVSIAIGENAITNMLFFKKISDFPVFLASDYEEVLQLFENLTFDICTEVLKRSMF